MPRGREASEGQCFVHEPAAQSLILPTYPHTLSWHQSENLDIDVNKAEMRLSRLPRLQIPLIIHLHRPLYTHLALPRHRDLGERALKLQQMRVWTQCVANPLYQSHVVTAPLLFFQGLESKVQA
jgi:hypothetical protein